MLREADVDTSTLYLSRLAGRDLDFLAQTLRPGQGPAWLRSELARRPQLIEELLGAREPFDRLLGGAERQGLEVGVGPFLFFAVLVHRLAAEVGELDFVQEWIGPRQRLPLFEVESLRRFLAIPSHRYHLTELLASYSRVASGSIWVRTNRGLRRRRFSELDPGHLASLLEVSTRLERPAVLRRLGDLALFLTGVFPDHTAGLRLAPEEVERLARSARMSPTELAETWAGPGLSLGTVGILEELGRRWYLLAEEASRMARPGLGEPAEDFRPARRSLNLLADRYLYPLRPTWFSPPIW